MKIHVEGDVEKFIESLEEITFAKVIRTINLLEKFEYKLSLPHATSR